MPAVEHITSNGAGTTYRVTPDRTGARSGLVSVSMNLETHDIDIIRCVTCRSSICEHASIVANILDGALVTAPLWTRAIALPETEANADDPEDED